MDWCELTGRFRLLAGIACGLSSCCPPPPLDFSQPLAVVRRHAPDIGVDLRYQTAENFARRPLYPPDFEAMLHPGTLKRLIRANRMLARRDLRLVIWDAYRPHRVQLELWDACGHDDTFVANPHRQPSLHSHGCAVDVTLQHLDGKPAAVPTGFDEFSHRAHCDFVHPDPEVRQNLRWLREAMWAAGFGTLPHEWWHFMDKDYRTIPCIDEAQHPGVSLGIKTR
jgi:D-alanyl-D-alanine dipeptidase